MAPAATRVVILGAGPAGMTCANALLTFGIEAIVVERSDHPGGAQRTNFHPNLWLLGAPEESGREVTQRMVGHFRALPIPLHLTSEIAHVAREGGRLRIDLDGAEGRTRLEADALVIATGMRPRATAELLALAARSRRVIVGPLSDAIRDEVRAARVLILGGGDNALDHALYLAERGNRVTVCTRRGFSARRGFVEACSAWPAIETRAQCAPDRLEADEAGIEATWGRTGERYDWLLVMYGYQPNTELLSRFDAELRPRLTESGHIEVDGWQRTSVPDIFAAGDITPSIQPSVAIAVAHGLAAAKAIERHRHTPE